jgi:hypothetical protein
MVGGRKIEHLHQNIKALTISLTPAQIEYLESINTFDVGFPHTIVVRLVLYSCAMELVLRIYRVTGPSRTECSPWSPRPTESRSKPRSGPHSNQRASQVSWK